jgi:hypothetical protein
VITNGTSLLHKVVITNGTSLLHKVVIPNGTSLLHKVVITNGKSLRLTATSSVQTVFCKRCHRGASHGLPVKPPVSEAQDALRPVSRAL